MTFPFQISIGSRAISLHIVFEALAYTLAFLLFRILRKRAGDPLGGLDRLMIVAAAAVGALVGAKLLHIANDWRSIIAPGGWIRIFVGGKTVVGGFLGGWAAVEWWKRRQGITTRTGDAFALPLCLGIGVGRIGCFLGGLEDNTYGIPTSLPIGVDFGDGLPRHPTQAYEIAFALLAGLVIFWRSRRPFPRGFLFHMFMTSYLAFRLGCDFLKPYDRILGLCAIQWACVAGLVVCFRRRFAA